MGFSQEVGGVRVEVFELVNLAGGPVDLEAVYFFGVAEPEVETGVGGGEEAAAADPLGDLSGGRRR